MQEVRIRHSEAGDIPAIKAIYEGRAAAAGTLQLPYSSIELWRSRLETLPANSYSLVADLGGEIVGQIGFDVCTSPRRRHCGNFGMAVREGYTGRGVGSRLLAAVLDLADNWLNLKRIEITVYTDNDAAVALYTKHGFRIEGESPAYAFRNGEYVSVYHMGRVRDA